ncbi:CRISPR-associated DxTHG motif protein [Campylobacter sp. FMV-PI01]|uniref:CRISPR-associated DxTHG motif protein n=1 Tax=Campylobacter portucalensis TaxID=2608384 RepID=A0A6L5WHZ7_9BACT|nr:TM1812 family CRISPR-associated protein [Campylobacter portucalensis]MSN96878.1 CRISPR-associated DxTHG motif protein [Campylobacter portucalensis]
MFPLLLENFDEVVAIYTKEAKNKQEEVIKNEGLTYKFNSKYFISNENDFDMAFKVINRAIDESNEDFIVDLSHGFRHLPILAIISILSQNLQNSIKIKHIFFAKEIIKFKEYEIIDLKEFLDIANLSFILENFNQNYTLTKIEFKNEAYNALAKGLENLSHNILSNSIQNLYKEKLLKSTLNSLEQISKNELFDCFSSNIDNTINHLNYLLSLEKDPTYIRLYKFSKDLASKGYILNATTIFYEAAGIYSIQVVSNSSSEVKRLLQKFYKSETRNKDYLLSNFCYSFIKNGQVNRKNKRIEKVLSYKFDKAIRDYLNLKPNYKKLKRFYKDLDSFRNNLAHANSGEIIEDPYEKLNSFLESFGKFISSDFDKKDKNVL